MIKYGRIIKYNGSSGEIICIDGFKYILLEQNILYKEPKIGDIVSFKEEIYKTPEICEKVATFIKKVEKKD